MKIVINHKKNDIKLKNENKINSNTVLSNLLIIGDKEKVIYSKMNLNLFNSTYNLISTLSKDIDIGDLK